MTSVVSDALGRVEAPGEGRAFMQRFDVTYEYPVYFTRDVFAEQNVVLAEAITRLGREMRSKIAVFVDDGVTREMPDLARRIASYAQAHSDDIELAGSVIVVKGGEGCKNEPALVAELQSKLVELGLDRHSYVVAVGGGALLDVVGYVAATTHRGIRHIRIPTTVLAQNDSGVGVKNGVNAFDIKNLFGTFEPAFWIGQARTNAGSYADYLSHILGFERFRAGQFGVRHYCCIGLNSKEANNEALAEAVMEILPGFATKEGVVAIGEIGYDEQTAMEDKYFRLQLDLARELDLPVMIHTPHRDKKRGASRSMDVILEHGLNPSRVVIDHVNEETVKEVKDRGFFAAFSIYPHSKMTAERMFEIVRAYGPERLIVDSACDWGVSDPLSVPKTAKLLAERGIPEDHIRQVTYGNALAVYGESGQMWEEDWLAPAAIDQRTLYQGNTVLRGGQTPKVETARN